MGVCKAKAEEVRNRAGDGFATSEYVGRNRVNVSVYAETWAANKRALDDNTLFKGMR